MNETTPPPEGSTNKLVDEQLELAASKLPVLVPQAVHPSPVDHDERSAPHATLEDVLLGNAQASTEMLEELARQALADGGADGDPSTPE